jgi:hypothetical protein
LLKTNSVSKNRTFNHKFFEYKELESEMIDGKRYYKTPTGEKLDWRARVGEAEANKITAIATRRGTKVHSLCERYILNEEDIGRGMMPTDIDLFKQLQPTLDERVGDIYGIEIPLYSHELKTAGRCDLICVFDGCLTILDYKTSRKLKKEEWIKNYFLQATAYSMMLEETYGIVAPSLAILIAVDDQTAPQLFTKSCLELRSEAKLVFSQYHANQGV